MTRAHLFILLICAAAGLAGYLFRGAPGASDLPMSMRQEALAKKIASDPASLTEAELLARLEAAIKEQPNAPEPHYFIGRMLAEEGRLDEAARAFQSALRRNPDYVPALRGLADVIADSANGTVTAEARALYQQVYALDSNDAQAGMRAAMGAFQAGDAETARTEMLAIYEALPADDPRREQYRSMYEAMTRAPPAK